jgi:hypothetical protein
MRTISIVIQVPASDQAAATTALEGAGFKVRLDLDHPVDKRTTALELVISYPMAENDDVEADHQAFGLRDKTLKEAGIEFQHLANGVFGGTSLSTFTVWQKNARDEGERTVLAKDWSEFLSVWGSAYGDFDEEALEVSVVGLAANDPRN